MIPSLPHHRLPRLFLGLYTVISRLVGRNVEPAESVPRSLFVAFYPPGFRFLRRSICAVVVPVNASLPFFLP